MTQWKTFQDKRMTWLLNNQLSVDLNRKILQRRNVKRWWTLVIEHFLQSFIKWRSVTLTFLLKTLLKSKVRNKVLLILQNGWRMSSFHFWVQTKRRIGKQVSKSKRNVKSRLTGLCPNLKFSTKLKDLLSRLIDWLLQDWLNSIIRSTQRFTIRRRRMTSNLNKSNLSSNKFSNTNLNWNWSENLQKTINSFKLTMKSTSMI